MIHLDIKSSNEIEITPLMDPKYKMKPFWIAKRDKTSNKNFYEFFSRFRFNSFFILSGLQPGDEIHTGVKNIPESKKKWIIISINEHVLTLKEEEI